MTDNRPVDVLRFWRDVEIFNIPTTPKRERKDELRVAHFQSGTPLPWQPHHKDALVATDSKEWSHAVFLGVTAARSWAQELLQTVCPDANLDERDLQQLSGHGWIAAFNVNCSGRMVRDSYVPASFTLGMRRLLAGQTLDGLSEDIKAQTEAFKERCPQQTIPSDKDEKAQEPNTPNADNPTKAYPPPQPIGWDELHQELQHALRTFGAASPDFPLTVVIKSILRKRRQSEDATKVDSDIDFLNSFYLNDLDRLINEASRGHVLGKALTQYLGPNSADKRRQDILRQPEAMASCLSPRKLTMGRWPAPSKHHLMLAQQAAVGHIAAQLHQDMGLVAVNGPPGTGKTTLLCDIVADIVVQRALALSSFEQPWQVFGKKTIIGGMDVFPLPPKVMDGSGIVVTSNNNTAVENITRDLPALAKIAQDEHPGAGYFQEIAAQVFAAAAIKAPAWGLVAAALGNSDNRHKFANAFFREDQKEPFQPGQPCDIKTRLEASPDDALKQWQEARQTFLELFDQVKTAKQNFSNVANAVESCATLRVQEAQQRREIDNGRAMLASLPGTWANRLSSAEAADKTCRARLERTVESEQLAKLQAQVASDRLQVAESAAVLSLWDRCLRRLGIMTKRYRDWSSSTGDLRLRRADAAEAWRNSIEAAQRCKLDCSEAETQLREIGSSYQREQMKLKTMLHTQQQQLKQRQLLSQQLDEQIQAFKATGATVPDSQFFSLDATEQNLASAWVDPSFDSLRARLFLAALRLHETTLLASNYKAIANLRAFKKMLMRDTPEPIPASQRGILWNILFFTVPVVSSTLASFDRLFVGLGRESLGWLLIDEAGQATPQSVAGALWRSKRAVIIGDPLQIEPVMTVPGAVVTELRRRHGIDAQWSPAKESAQTLADRTMTLGAWIGGANPDTGVWTGLPLRAHRRCIDPMFSVANRIAYAGQMVQANKHPAPINCLLGDSAWLDVRGSSSEGQIVPDEMKYLEVLLLKLRANWPTTGDGKLAKLFVISPFRKVAEECGGVFKRAGMYKKDWPVDWGTVHRFQGKEADIVLIVLGSAPGRAGSGSRTWASSKPNLLNVALTRAKQRVYVIGNYADWASCPQFEVLAAELPVRQPTPAEPNVAE